MDSTGERIGEMENNRVERAMEEGGNRGRKGGEEKKRSDGRKGD